MADPKKVANNILDFLIDPTKVPVKERVYFRPEENLQNETYEKAKADAFALYKEQAHNSDFYPSKRTTQREASKMDRKSLIASFDILSKNFREENDPIAKDLRTMAFAFSKMSDEEVDARLADSAPDFEGMAVEAAEMSVEAKGKGQKTCPDCGQKLFCMTCSKGGKKKPEAEKAVEASAYTNYVGKFMKENPDKSIGDAAQAWNKNKKEASEEEVEASVEDDFWTKEASDRVSKAIVASVLGIEAEDKPVKPAGPEIDPKTGKPVTPPKAPEACAKEAAKKVEPIVAEDEPIEPPMPISMPSDSGSGVEISIKVNKAAKEEKPVDPKAPKADPDAPKADPDAPEGVTPVESTVNTDVLASIQFNDMDAGVFVTAEDVGEMSDEEKTKLAQLFSQE